MNLIYTLGRKVANQRQHRWCLFFQEYNFIIKYRQGKKNGKHSLSRRRDNIKNNIEEKPENILDIKNVKEIPCFVSIVSDLLERIIDSAKPDATAEDIRLYFSPQNVKNDMSYKPFRKMEKFKIKDNLIFYNNLVYIPEILRLEILTKYH